MAIDTRVLERDLRSRSDPGGDRELLAGVTGGLLSGAAMLAWLAASAASAGLPATRPLALAAATFLGEDAVDGGAGAVLLGALLWAVVSVVFALPWTLLVPRDFPFPSAAILGVGYMLIVLGLTVSWALPAVNPTMRAAMRDLGGAWAIAYGLFGLGLGFVPLLRRRLSRPRRR
jgi:hypothetical protein